MNPLIGPIDVPPYPTVLDAIEAQVARHPDRLALLDDKGELTYAQLQRVVEELARRLSSAGVRPGDRVGLAVGRNRYMVVGLLAILRAGASVVPVDVSAPQRLRVILQQAEVSVVVGDVNSDVGMPLRTVSPLPDQHCRQAIESPLTVELPSPPTAEDEAYVLFTSGSTGLPKGVRVNHQSLGSFAWAFGRVCGVGSHTKGLVLGALIFDVAVLEIFVPLVHGGTVVIAGDSQRADHVVLQHFCRSQGINFGFLPVVLLPLLNPDDLPDWLVLATGAEAPGPEQVQRWTAGPVARRLVNCYGPTEATVCVSVYEAVGVHTEALPIGRPLPNHQILVADHDQRPVAAGAVGEILIAGVGLAIGYLNEAADSGSFFVAPNGTRYYRTGDLGRIDAAGLLHFCGRKDRQVKVRGHRVELADVEAAATSHPDVDSARVVVTQGEAGSILHLWYSGSPSPEDVREWVAARLTPGLRPATVRHTQVMPVSATGKIDGSALLARTTAEPVGDSLDPADDPIGAAWLSATGAPPEPGVGFYAAGGSSVSAMMLCDNVFRSTGRRIFASTVLTVADADDLRRWLVSESEAGIPCAASELALSAPQYRHWLGVQLTGRQSRSIIQVVRRLTGPVNAVALAAALETVINRHDILRLQVPTVGGEPRPTIGGAVRVRVSDIVRPGALGDIHSYLRDDREREFDVTNGPLWRAALVTAGEEQQILVLTFEHLVADGWSMSTVLSDLSQAYRLHLGMSEELGPPPPPFAAHVLAERERRAHRGEADTRWWVDQLAELPGALPLPFRVSEAFPEAPESSADPTTPVLLGRTIPGLVDQLLPWSTSDRRLADVFVAVMGEWLSRRSQDCVLGLVHAGRDDPAFHRTVGMFVDVLPLRWRQTTGLDGANRSSRSSAVTVARQAIADASAHSASSLSDIVRALRRRGDLGANNLVQVALNIYNFTIPPLDLPGISDEHIEPPAGGAPFDLTIYVRPQVDGALLVQCAFRDEVFAEAVALDLLDEICELLMEWGGNPPRVDSAVPDSCGDSNARTSVGGVAVVRRREYGKRALVDQPPRSHTETVIQAIWALALDIDPPGVTDNFFDVGGHSSAVPLMRSLIQERCGVELSLVDIFSFPTVRALAEHIDATDNPSIQNPAPSRGAARRARRRRPLTERKSDPREDYTK